MAQLEVLTPQEMSDLLWTEFRIRRSLRRLAELRQIGTGPPYVRDGKVVRYLSGPGREWAVKHLGEPATSTAEESARRQRASA